MDWKPGSQSLDFGLLVCKEEAVVELPAVVTVWWFAELALFRCHRVLRAAPEVGPPSCLGDGGYFTAEVWAQGPCERISLPESTQSPPGLAHAHSGARARRILLP